MKKIPTWLWILGGGAVAYGIYSMVSKPAVKAAAPAPNFVAQETQAATPLLQSLLSAATSSGPAVQPTAQPAEATTAAQAS